MNIHEQVSCAYCGTEFTIEFEKEDDELAYCPSCGEMIVEDEDEDYEELDFYGDE